MAEFSRDHGGDGGRRGASHPGEAPGCLVGWSSIHLQGWGAARQDGVQPALSRREDDGAFSFPSAPAPEAHECICRTHETISSLSFTGGFFPSLEFS